MYVHSNNLFAYKYSNMFVKIFLHTHVLCILLDYQVIGVNPTTAIYLKAFFVSFSVCDQEFDIKWASTLHV